MSTLGTGDAATLRGGDPTRPLRESFEGRRYLPMGIVGRGAMGVVRRAYDPRLQREVALKRVLDGGRGAAAIRAIVAEARAMARVAHRNVVQVYDVEVDPEQGVTLVMAYVEGVTATTWLDQQPRSTSEILDALDAAGRGLRAVHEVGMLHLDFKLDNILVDADGTMKITDFGLAESSYDRASASDESGESASTSSQPGKVRGTPLFMSPEQLSGEGIDPRSDQYSFCIALWHALTGQWPFTGGYHELAAAKFAGPPVRLRERDGTELRAKARVRAMLASILRNEGRVAEAVAEHRRALRSYEEVLGPDHPDLATVRDNLAVALYHLGEYDEAETELRQALGIARTSLSDEHSIVFNLRDHLGAVYGMQRDFAAAETEHRAAVAGRVAAYGKDHPSTAESRTNLAFDLRMLDRRRDAVEQYQLAVDAFARALGTNDDRVADTLGKLGETLLELADPDAALVPLERAWQIRRQSPDRTRRSTTATLLARALHEAGRDPDRVAALERVGLAPSD